MNKKLDLEMLSCGTFCLNSILVFGTYFLNSIYKDILCVQTVKATSLSEFLPTRTFRIGNTRYDFTGSFTASGETISLYHLPSLITITNNLCSNFDLLWYSDFSFLSSYADSNHNAIL